MNNITPSLKKQIINMDEYYKAFQRSKGRKMSKGMDWEKAILLLTTVSDNGKKELLDDQGDLVFTIWKKGRSVLVDFHQEIKVSEKSLGKHIIDHI